MTADRHPYLLPHERSLMRRFAKNLRKSPRLQAGGPQSSTLNGAVAVDSLLGYLCMPCAAIVQIAAIITRVSDVEYAALALWGGAILLLLLAAVRQVQAMIAYHRYRKGRNREQLTPIERGG